MPKTSYFGCRGIGPGVKVLKILIDGATHLRHMHDHEYKLIFKICSKQLIHQQQKWKKKVFKYWWIRKWEGVVKAVKLKRTDLSSILFPILIWFDLIWWVTNYVQTCFEPLGNPTLKKLCLKKGKISSLFFDEFFQL